MNREIIIFTGDRQGVSEGLMRDNYKKLLSQGEKVLYHGIDRIETEKIIFIAKRFDMLQGYKCKEVYIDSRNEITDGQIERYVLPTVSYDWCLVHFI